MRFTLKKIEITLKKNEIKSMNIYCIWKWLYILKIKIIIKYIIQIYIYEWLDYWWDK